MYIDITWSWPHPPSIGAGAGNTVKVLNFPVKSQWQPQWQVLGNMEHFYPLGTYSFEVSELLKNNCDKYHLLKFKYYTEKEVNTLSGICCHLTFFKARILALLKSTVFVRLSIGKGGNEWPNPEAFYLTSEATEVFYFPCELSKCLLI